MTTLLSACCLALNLLTLSAGQQPGRPAAKPTHHPAPNTTATIKTGNCDKVGDYNLPPQRFDETSQAIAHATGCFVRYDDTSLASVRVNAVRGHLSIRQALQMALRGTRLRIVQQTPDELRVEAVKAK